MARLKQQFVRKAPGPAERYNACSMACLGPVSEGKVLFNSCQFGGRIFSVAQRDERLALTSVQLGDTLGEEERVLGIPLSSQQLVSICKFGNALFVLVLEQIFFSFGVREGLLLHPGDDSASLADIEVIRLTPQGEQAFLSVENCMTQLSAAEVFVSMNGSSKTCLITISEPSREMKVEKLPDPLPGRIMYDCALFTTAGMQVFALGGFSKNADHLRNVTLVADSGRSFRELAPLPGVGGAGIGCCALQDMLIGFGSGAGSASQYGSLLLYDVRRQTSCLLTLFQNNHPRDEQCILALHRGFLYIVGGAKNFPCARLALSEMAQVIPNPYLRSKFSLALRGGSCSVQDWISCLQINSAPRALSARA